MKKKEPPASFPTISKQEVAQEVEKSEVIYLRVTPAEKEAVKKTAALLKMTVTEYLLRCHEAIQRKL